MTDLSTKTERTRVRRYPERGVYDREVIDAILDEALYCHLAFSQDGQVFAIPTLFARVGDSVYLHGSVASRALQESSEASGPHACVTVTLFDGLVLARSAFFHSANYRSVVILGQPSGISDREEKLIALESFVNKVIPGRWDDVRHPTENELEATQVLVMPLTEASAKIRTGPPKDRQEDLDLETWAGVIPLELRAGRPITDPEAKLDIPAPDYVESFSRRIATPSLNRDGQGG